jgi:hypothetical protein
MRERLDPGHARARREFATLVVRPFDATTRSSVTAEGEQLVRFVADDAADHRVTVVQP